MCGLWQRWDRIMTWPIVQVCFMLKTKLNCHDWSDKLRFVTKTIQDNDVTNHIDVVYAEIGIELSWMIRQDVVYHKKQTREWRDRSYKCDFRRIQYWTVKINRIVCSLLKRRDQTTMWPTILVICMLKTKLTCYDWFDGLQPMAKTR